MAWYAGPLASGDIGTTTTLALMRQTVDAGRRHPAVRAAALEAVRGQVAADPLTVARAVGRWLRAHTTFTRDPVDTELVRAPHILLDALARHGAIQADCNNLVTLYAAMVEALGFPVEFLVQGPTGGDYSHVLALVQTDRGPLPFDPSNPTSDIGWRPSAGVGREATMGARLGEDYLQFNTPSEVVNAPASEHWWSSLVSGVSSVAGAVLPLAERYGVLSPVVGYNADGTPRYASATLPLSASQAGYTAATQPVLFGMSLPVLALLGAGAFLLTSRRR